MFNNELGNQDTFKDLDWTEEQKQSKSFCDCVFEGCDFTKTDFSGTEFVDAIFQKCNLSLTDLNNCRLRSVVFVKSKLIGIDFRKCNPNFFSISFKNCLLDSCNFSCDFKYATFDFCGSVLRKCIFIETDLHNTDFSECDLEETTFHNCNLEGADFIKAKNYQINPKTNKIKNAKFSLPEAVLLLGALDIDLRN
ncbi:pentapeptide repeat-containing protein [Patescibacteria group bacterium]